MKFSRLFIIPIILLLLSACSHREGSVTPSPVRSVTRDENRRNMEHAKAAPISLASSHCPKFRVDLADTGRSGVKGPDSFKVIWRFKSGGKIARSPVVDESGNIYFGASDSMFYSLSSDGNLRWKVKLDEWVDSAAALASDGSVYVGCDDGNLAAISKEGKILWKYYLHAEISSSPAIANGLVYAGSEDGILYGLDSAGKEQVKFKAKNRILVSSPLVTGGGEVIIGAEDHNVYAINPDGSLKWKYLTDTEEAFTSPPMADSNGNIYLATPDKKIISLDFGGQKRWETGVHEEIFAPMALDSDNNIYAVALDGVLLSYGPGRKLRWKKWVDRKTAGGPIIDSSSRLYICGEKSVYLYDRDGGKKTSFSLDSKTGIITTQPVITAEGKICFGAGEYLYCVGEN